MPTLSDSSIHEDEDAIVAEYEKRDLDDNRDSNDNRDLNQIGESGQENDESTGRRIDPSTSKKHIVRNPIPKLNTERLKGPKGIHTIEKYFEGFKFHGKGHEKADLDRVMKRLEHWAHRLFPKLDFDDFLERTETLGNKRDLQVHITKYRQDMLTLDDDVPTENIDVEEDKGDKEDNAPVDEFDILIAEQIEIQKQVANQHETSLRNAHADESANDQVFNELLARTVNKTTKTTKENASTSQLADEVKERMERNRQQALQRRVARLQAMQGEVKKTKLESTGDTLSSNENRSSELQDEQSIPIEGQDIVNDKGNNNPQTG